MDSSDRVRDTVNIPQPVINWLFKVIQPIYHDGRTTFHDSVALLSQFPQFRPRTRVFTSENGTSDLLLCIYGTIESILPVPLLVWIPRSYPLEHPLVFLDLELLGDSRPCIGDYVSPNGEVCLPLFNKWSPEANNILQVVQEASEICQYNSFVRPADAELHDIISLPTPTASSIWNQPDLPRKPPKKFSVDTSTNSNSSSSTDIPPAFPPKLPPKENDYSYSSESPLVPPRPAEKSSNIDLLDSKITNDEDPLRKHALLELGQIITQLTQKDVTFLQENLQKRKSAVESAVDQFRRMLEYETSSLQNVSNSIKKTKGSVENEITSLVHRNEALMVYEQQHGIQPDVSSLLVTENVLINQLYELVAKDCAISDTIHALSRLLSSDSIKLEIFVKKTRELAREQFLTRMHIQKVMFTVQSTR